MIDTSATIAEFLDAAAAKVPAPGGGAVTGLAGALAASMGEMVLQYSVGKKDLAEFAAANGAALSELTRARAVLLELMLEDQSAFEALTAAKKLGGDIEAAVLNCIRVPQAMGAAAVAILRIAVKIAATSNRWLLSDLAVCGELAMATVRCAIHNMSANFPSVTDAGLRDKAKADGTAMQREAIVLVNQLMAAIIDRTGDI